MTYRSDIDGLRAVAVLSVILYHFKLGLVSGGFVGVDVFFVISGYLITAIIAREIEEGRFSFLVFYERRIRRIFPALFVLLVGTTLYGSVVLYPSELKELSGSIVATLSFVSNFYFYSLSGYFRPDVELKPLLHTWSLAVEEQYYLVFPIFLMLITRHARRFVVPAIAMAGLASLALSVWLVRQHPAEAFYFSPPRFWEMLVGSFLALARLPVLTKRWLREAVAGGGLALIVAAALFYKSGMPFPGLYALPPVLGAAAVIYAGQGGSTMTFRFLSLRPMVLVGLMSYSLYLWHWPIAAYGHLRLDRPLQPSDAWFLVPLTAVLSFLSWRFVERPFRRPDAMRRSRLWATNLGLSFAGIALGIVIATGSGLPWRFSPEVASLASNLEYDDRDVYRRGTCFLDGENQSASDYPSDLCLAKDPSKPSYLLIGDSHGAHLWPGLHAALPEANVLQATSSGCKPVENSDGLRNCVAFMNGIFDRIETIDPQLVILSARWVPGDLPKLISTLEMLRAKGRRVVVLGPIAEYRIALARLLADAVRTDRPDLPMSRRVPAIAETDELFRLRMAALSVPYVSVHDLICAEETSCQTRAPDGSPMQWDYGHLTQSGSIEMAKRIAPYLRSPLSQTAN